MGRHDWGGRCDGLAKFVQVERAVVCDIPVSWGLVRMIVVENDPAVIHMGDVRGVDWLESQDRVGMLDWHSSHSPIFEMQLPRVVGNRYTMAGGVDLCMADEGSAR